MTDTEKDDLGGQLPNLHAERLAEQVQKRQPSSRARELAMASAAMSGVSLGMWIVASLSHFQFGLTTFAIVLTLVMCLLAVLAYRDFATLSRALRTLKSENERMADNLWEASETEERASSLFDQMGDLIVIFDTKRIIADANLNFAFALDKPMNEIIGKTLGELGLEFPSGRIRSATKPVEVKINGRWYSWIEFRSPGTSFENTRFRAVARDIHQHKEGERLLVEARRRAEAANLAKSQFLATVSHEIRTPLNGISGMTRLLADTPLTPEQKTYVDAVSSSGQALVTLIEDLLDFSKIEAGRIDLRPEPVDIRSLAEGLIELMASRAHAKGIGAGLHIAANVPEKVVTDPHKLRQALLNLLGNAIKFTETDGFTLDISSENGNLRFTVLDKGPGIAKADQDRIFLEFEQAEAGKTRRHGGAGLGLAITKRIIDAMGGSVEVVSRQGEGAAFALVLPNLSQTAAEPARPLAGQACKVVMASGLEGLAVSDTLETLGATVIKDDLANHSSQMADVLLIDVRSLRNFENKAEALPEAKRRIILIEPGERGLMPEMLSKGFETWLVRPVRMNTLVRALAGTMTDDGVQAARQTAGDRRRGGRQLSVLVAEDNEINALLVRSALTKAGHEVTVVGDGRSAVDEVLQGSVKHDVILMDLHMPVMDGLDAIAAIRTGEDERGLKPVPVLALTADGQVEVENNVRSVGGNGFITKPVDPARLVGLVEETAAAA